MIGSRDAAAAWIYGGVWAGVVALFRVPAEPPTLPAPAGGVRTIRPAPGYLQYLKFFFRLLLIPGDVVPIVVWSATVVAFPIVGIALVPAVVIVVIAPDVIAYVAIHLRYDTTWYVFTDRSLRIRRGIWVIHETTISFENVQNVEVCQGPVQRFFGIADVIVQTAGGGGGGHGKGEGETSPGPHVGILQGLVDAGAVRDAILACVTRTQSTGLGDEHPGALNPVLGRMTSAPSSAHLAVLRDIRDVARRLARGSAR